MEYKVKSLSTKPQNLQEAVQLHIEDEDMEELGLKVSALSFQTGAVASLE